MKNHIQKEKSRLTDNVDTSYMARRNKGHTTLENSFMLGEEQGYIRFHVDSEDTVLRN